MSEKIILCTRRPDEQGYEWFWHEADVLLYALGQEVAAQIITSEQAREIYAGHYDARDTYEVKPEDIESEKATVLEDWEKFYDSRGEADEYLEQAFGDYGNFPSNEELDHLPRSTEFWEDADKRRLEGAGLSVDISPASGPVFVVENDDALAELKQAYQGHYQIIVCNDVNDFVLHDHEEAIRFVDRMRQDG